jgi:hypothetical protein
MKPDDYLNSIAGRVIKTAQGTWAFLPNPLPPKLAWSSLLVSDHSEAERGLARLAQAGRDFPHSHILTPSFVRSEAASSSRIEGTRATLEDLYSIVFWLGIPMIQLIHSWLEFRMKKIRQERRIFVYLQAGLQRCPGFERAGYRADRRGQRD